MIHFTTFGRIRLKSVLAKVFHPERCRVANVALFELEARNHNVTELVTHGTVKLRHINLLRWDRITEWRSNVFLHERWKLSQGPSLLHTERVIVAIEEDRLFKAVVSHGRVVQNLVLVHEVLDIFRLDVPNGDPELSVVALEANILRQDAPSTVVKLAAFDWFVATGPFEREGGDIDPKIRLRLDLGERARRFVDG